MRLVSLWPMLVALGVLALVVLPLASRGVAQERTGPYAGWKMGPPADPAYFPIAVWLQDPANAARYKAAGINLYIALWQGPTEKQLAALKAAGMPVICDQNAVGLAHLEDPTIVGWMHGDEPDNAQAVKDAAGKNTWGPCIPPARIVADYERIRAADPSRPVLLNLGQGVANDQWYGRGTGAKLSDYETFVKGGDIISFDVYPVASRDWQDGAERLWLVPKGVDRLVQWTGGRKIIWNCIECTRISGGNQATPEQVKAEVWMALTHGSTGLIYFVHQFQPKFREWALLEDKEMLPAVTALNQQIQRLAPVLNSPTLPDAVQVASRDAQAPISAMAKRVEGATYVFAVGMRNAPTQGTFTVRGAPPGATVEVLDENRTLTLKDGVFEDSFTPYAVHLYRIR